MDANALNTALAKWDGWKRIEPTRESAWGAHPKGYPETKVYYYPHELPRYTESLDAVHELEKKLPYELWSSYTTALAIMAQSKEKQCSQSSFHMNYVCATAIQRCEAMARTLNL